MSGARLRLERVARRIGGPRVLALPLLRTLAVLAGFVRVVLAPAETPARRGLQVLPVDSLRAALSAALTDTATSF